MYFQVPSAVPSQQSMPPMVYLQNISAGGVPCYPADTNFRDFHPPQQQQQPVTYLYPSSQTVQKMSMPPMQTTAPFGVPSNGISYYLCSTTQPHETLNNGGVVYLLSPVASSLSSSFPMLIHPVSSNPSSLYDSLNSATQERNSASAIMPTLPQAEFVPLAAPSGGHAAGKPTDSASHTGTTASASVCRHYLNGRCNRRKCRFLHPDPHMPLTAFHVPSSPTGAASLSSSLEQHCPNTPSTARYSGTTSPLSLTVHPIRSSTMNWCCASP